MLLEAMRRAGVADPRRAVMLGDSVTAEQALVTIEAMKMNTYVYASQAGTVTEVLVKAGDSVEEGSVLIRLG
jgi:biotin carboxyl carrier protein